MPYPIDSIGALHLRSAREVDGSNQVTAAQWPSRDVGMSNEHSN